MSTCMTCGAEVAEGDNVCEACFNRPFICPQCGGPKQGYQEFCSEACAFAAEPHKFHLVNCVWCGVSFRTAGAARYCSGKCRVATHRARKAGDTTLIVTPTGLALRFAILQRDNYRCVYCGRTAHEARLEIDHVDPVSKGGAGGMDNLVTACYECNRGKRDVILTTRPAWI